MKWPFPDRGAELSHSHICHWHKITHAAVISYLQLLAEFPNLLFKSGSMKIKFDVHTEPPRPEIIGPMRKRHEKSLPFMIGALILCFLLAAAVYFHFGGKYPDWQAELEYALIGSGMLCAILIWKLAVTIISLTQLNEAHPVTANAYLECASNPFVKSYCAKVIRQGRNLSLGEADMLLKLCQTREDIIRLAIYYEEHAPLAMFGFNETPLSKPMDHRQEAQNYRKPL